MKVCFKCKVEKSIGSFYVHKGMKDGRLNKCIDCTKNDANKREKELKNNPEWVEKERLRHNKKYHNLYSPYNEENPKPKPIGKKESMRLFYEKYPEKYKAKSMSGKLKAKTKGNHLHHWSYNEEHYKDVIELSVEDHNTVHRLTIYDQERRMYRALDGRLLDSKITACRYYLEKGINTQIIIDILYNKV